jgi:hypothetical protein
MTPNGNRFLQKMTRLSLFCKKLNFSDKRYNREAIIAVSSSV